MDRIRHGDAKKSCQKVVYVRATKMRGSDTRMRAKAFPFTTPHHHHLIINDDVRAMMSQNFAYKGFEFISALRFVEEGYEH